MKLITELYDDVTNIITESTDGKKHYYIEGVFAQAVKTNRNGRSYPLPVMQNEVNRYQDAISKKRSLGELNHPNTPQINPERASHLVTELKMEGHNVVGKAKLLETPCGRIVKALVDEGVGFGVSTRGVGSMKHSNGINEVQNDFRMSAIDIVSDPSAHDAWVTGIMEGADWIYVEGKGWVPQYIEESKAILHKTKSKDIEAVAMQIFENFVKKL